MTEIDDFVIILVHSISTSTYSTQLISLKIVKVTAKLRRSKKHLFKICWNVEESLVPVAQPTFSQEKKNSMSTLFS